MAEKAKTSPMPARADEQNSTDAPHRAQETGILRHELDADDALKGFVEVDGADIVLDEATTKQRLRRVDMMLLPVRKRREGEGRKERRILLIKKRLKSFVWCMDSIFLIVRGK